MKRYALIIILLVSIVSACSSGHQTESVTIYKMNSFSDTDVDSAKGIIDSDEIDLIQSAIKNAVKRPGIADMTDPEFMIKVSEQSFYLWIEEEAGTIMNVEDTHTTYSLEKKNAKEVKKIVDRYFQ